MKAIIAVRMYLSGISEAVRSLSRLVVYRTDGIEQMPLVITTMLELEQSTADFIAEMGFDSVIASTITALRKQFLRANEEVIEHIEKLQLQGKNFDELQTALKLENETLRKEINFS